MRNTGKTSEEIVEAYYASLGKRAWLERRIDAAHVRGLNKGLRLAFPSQPSDYLLTLDGVTSYLEVKSCSSKTSFPFSQFESGQWAAMKRVTAAGGSYVVLIHSLGLDRWFRVPAKTILEVEASGKSSMSWLTLQEFAWEVPDLGPVAAE